MGRAWLVAAAEFGPQPRHVFGDSELATTSGFVVLAALFVLVAVAAWRRLERGPNGELPYEVTLAMGAHVLREVRARELRAIAAIGLAILAGRHYGLWSYLGNGAAVGLVYLAFRIGDLVIALRALRLCTAGVARATVFGGCLVIRNRGRRASVFLTRRARGGVMPVARTSL